MTMIKDTIIQLKAIVAQSDTGHLPLSFRIELMKQVGDVLTVQKIMCECCKKACSVTGRQIMDNVHLLSRINEHLYRKRDSVEDIEKESGELWLHVQNNPDETTTTVSWAIASLGYFVYGDAASMLDPEDYEGEDDDSFDPESMDVDFIVSLVCSGGSPFSDNWKGDVEKRREYWNWYLDMILAMYENPQQEIIPVPPVPTDSLEELRDQALDVHRAEGDVGDTLNEIRKKWGEEIPVLKEGRFDEVVMQYSCFSHEMGITALGQELSSYGYALYDLNGDDIYLLALVPQAEMQAFEEKCRKYGQYCKLLKQSRYDFGMKARTIKLRRQMPRERLAWPNDGNRYITRGFAGYFAYGEWRQADVEKWQGTFVADLRVTPLQPVKQRKTKIKALLYSEELDFYAALSSYSKWSTFAVGGRNPLEADEWPRLSGLSLESPHEFRWCGRYLCMGDIHSATIFTMSSRGMKYESRFIFIDRMNYPPSFGIDGKGMPYIIPGEFSRSSVYRYEGNGKYYRIPFHMSGYDRFSSGCIPVPETSRLLLLGEYMARSNSGIWTEPGLLDLNMATQECRIAPLRMGDGSFRLREFYKEWVLVESRSNGNRTDYARLWNRKTDEVLRLRPGVLGNESFKSIHAIPDGTVIVNTLNKGDALYRAKDFWDFLRTGGRPKKLGYWLNYPKPYPEREYELPPLSEDVTLMLTPPFIEYPSAVPPAAKPQPAKSIKASPAESAETQVQDGIEITEGRLKINGRQMDMPVSYTAMVQIFGKERIVTTHKTMQDDRGSGKKQRIRFRQILRPSVRIFRMRASRL